MNNTNDHCLHCGKTEPNWNPCRKFCGCRCKAAHLREHGVQHKNHKHVCRMCRREFQITREQSNKWLCSDECRRVSVAKCVREFHLRSPERNAVYRARTKAKIGPDGNQRRFYKSNPIAPKACESCGEDRVLDVAHKPGLERNGERRSKNNYKWPEKVWVLCPTCHTLLDRMHYAPEELGLKL